ncbi:hypothetical protein VNO78_28319 [Psophocarpus tetragonolobus]|uniref:Helicase/UvrB N-terminal domain-containing protein n=1 Tax=Psophocarpus tetragonolobus TaxID=3891 RepID=A0AAN9XC71_PSOTE
MPQGFPLLTTLFTQYKIGKSVKSNSMMHRKRRVHQWNHPFHAYPLEALLSASWQAVELIKIESGTTTLHFIDNHHMTFDKGLFSDIRIRSRKATSSDCSYFLRPGMDICALSSSQCGYNSDEFSANHMWLDAKISSIQRKPHNPECSCQDYVNLYVNQGSLGTEIRSLGKEVKIVGTNAIAILQKLERNSCENKYYRWESSKDCSSVPHTKLLSGKFVSDLSWLVVTPALKNFSFCARSVVNKIVYQILDSGAISSSLNMDSDINVVNFEGDKEGTFMPIVIQVDVSDTYGSDHEHDYHNDEMSSSNGIDGLRRSKRRNIQPERYSGCGNVSEIKVGNVRTWLYKLNKRKADEESLPLAQVTGSQENFVDEEGDNSQKVNEMSSCRAITVYSRRNKTKEVKSGEANQNELKADSLTLERHPLNDKVPRSNAYYKSPKRTKLFGLEDDSDFAPRREGINFNKGVGEKTHGSYSYLKDVNTTPIKEETPVCNLGQKKEEQTPEREDEEKISEIDMLWREVEMGSNGGSFAENTEEANHTCQHDFSLNEEIGIYCFKCGFVKTEIKYITPPFLEKHHAVRHQEEKKCSGKEAKKADDDDFRLFSTHACRDELISIEHDNVWRLIPQLIGKMHVHQKKAFEFIWQNIGGSMEPPLMDAESERRGGCVISHAPGAGKTFLVIAFLISYLKLFPGKKPLVLAHKTTLHTWYKEFIKWEISVPQCI